MRNDGIGARMKGLYAMYSVAMKHNIPTLIIWDINKRFSCPFEMLFDGSKYDYVNCDFVDKGCNKPNFNRIINLISEGKLQPVLNTGRYTKEQLLQLIKSAVINEEWDQGTYYVSPDTPQLNTCDIMFFGRKIGFDVFGHPIRVRVKAPREAIHINPSILLDVQTFMEKNNVRKP
jgi:hypothetical protein